MTNQISPNSTIAQYTIVSKIGEGGMGEVWRTRDPKLGRDVAIKVLPPSQPTKIVWLVLSRRRRLRARSIIQQRFLIGTLVGESKSPPPTVIMNWTALLKK